MQQAFTPRQTCCRCDRPSQMCVCARLPEVDNRTGVLVLQHPRERTHAIGTAKLAKLALSNARVHVAWDAGRTEERAPSWLPANTALLYPGAHARELGTLAPSERPEHLLVLDGTWHTARALFRDKRWLRGLPQVRLTPAAPSRYRLRREPREDFVSTVEAIVQALELLEPETRGLDGLLAAFDAMIDAQLAQVGQNPMRRKLKPRRPLRERKLPRALAGELDELVVIYVESYREPSACGPGTHGKGAARELVQIAARSLATGAELERLIVPAAGLPSALALAHMQLSVDDFAHASERAPAVADLARFVAGAGQTAVLAAWNQSTLDLLATATGEPAPGISLKAAYRRLYGTRVASVPAHTLDEVIRAHGLVPPQSLLRGRAGARLANAVAIAKHLRAYPSALG